MAVMLIASTSLDSILITCNLFCYCCFCWVLFLFFFFTSIFQKKCIEINVKIRRKDKIIIVKRNKCATASSSFVLI